MSGTAPSNEDDQAVVGGGRSDATGAPHWGDGHAGEGSGDFAAALTVALRTKPRHISPRYLYDEAGSALFERICELPDYYPTRTEIGILREHVGSIAEAIGPRADLVEFGAGSYSKAGILLEALLDPVRYLPVDVASGRGPDGAHALLSVHPHLIVQPLAADFMHPLSLPARRPDAARRVGLFFGSTIGNLSVQQAGRFLARAAGWFSGGGLLVGVDLIKDPAMLHRAYNDPEGITARFNRNLLERANRELGADFDVEGFDHYAFYQPWAQRIEMHLISARNQTVTIGSNAFEFEKGESLQTEISHKYTVEGFQALARRCGLKPSWVWCDRDGRFSLHWLESHVKLAGQVNREQQH